MTRDMQNAAGHTTCEAKDGFRPETLSKWLPFGSRAFACLVLIQLTFGVAFSTFLLLPKYLVVHLAAGSTQVGIVTAAFALGAALSAPIVAPVCHRIGAAWCMAVAAVLKAVGACLFLLVTMVGPLAVLARAIQGASATVVFAAGSVMAASLVPPGRITSAAALFATSGLITSAVGPPAAEVIIERYGGGPVFLGAAFMALLSLVPCYWLARVASDECDRVARHPPQRSDSEHRHTTGLSSAHAFVTALVFGLASAVMFTFHQPLALERGIHRVSDFLVAFTLTATALRLTCGPLMDRIGHDRLAQWSFFGYAAVMIGMILLRPGQLLMFGVLFGITHGTFLPSLMAMSLDSGAERESRVAWMNIGTNVGGLGVLPLGMMASHTEFFVTFVSVGAIVALSAFSLAIPRHVARERGPV